MTLEDKLRALLDLRKNYADLRDKIAEAEEEIAADMESSELVIRNIGLVKRRQKSTRTKWDHEALFAKLYQIAPNVPAQVNLNTGEIIEDDLHRGIRIIKDAANPAWRTTKLRDYDIDPDEYSVRTPGGYTIEITEGIEGE